jgi:hypothetical protein
VISAGAKGRSAKRLRFTSLDEAKAGRRLPSGLAQRRIDPASK